MSECETVRGLKTLLEGAENKIREIKDDRNRCCDERDDSLEELTTMRLLVCNLRTQLETTQKERDSLREEIARRDAEKPVTALSWIEKTDARIAKIEARQDGTDAWKSGCADGWKDLEKRIESLTTSISSRLDGPTGVEKKIVAVESEMRRDFEACVNDFKEVYSRLAKLEARVSKKRVKK